MQSERAVQTFALALVCFLVTTEATAIDLNAVNNTELSAPRPC